jgi:hypothetical protein
VWAQLGSHQWRVHIHSSFTPTSLRPHPFPTRPRARRSFVTGTDAEVASAGGVVDPVRNVVVFQRYVHAHVRGELEALLAEAAVAVSGGVSPPPPLEDARPPEEREAVPLPAAVALPSAGAASAPGAPRVRLLSSWWDRDNWCFVAERV